MWLSQLQDATFYIYQQPTNRVHTDLSRPVQAGTLKAYNLKQRTGTVCCDILELTLTKFTRACVACTRASDIAKDDTIIRTGYVASE